MNGRLHAPTTYVAEYVQHALTFHIAIDPLAINPVIKKPAGLLTVQHRHHKAGTVLFEHHFVRQRAFDDVNMGLKTFLTTAACIVTEDDHLGFDDFFQRIDNLIRQRLHTRGIELHDEDITKTIDHQTWQQVAFAVDQAVERLRIKALTQCQRLIKAVYKQRTIQAHLGVTRHYPGSN